MPSKTAHHYYWYRTCRSCFCWVCSWEVYSWLHCQPVVAVEHTQRRQVLCRSPLDCNRVSGVVPETIQWNTTCDWVSTHSENICILNKVRYNASTVDICSQQHCRDESSVAYCCCSLRCVLILPKLTPYHTILYHISLPQTAGADWVSLGALFCTEVVYPSKDVHPSGH